ncbi:MAG: hypothetical protein LBQ55_05810, partial [Treponema sp.]|nr:hypothetical protein [Treponema sp.]
MSDSVKTRPPRPITRISLEILVFVFLVVLTALALRPLRNFMRSQAAAVRDEYLGRAEAILGQEIRYASMGPSIFGTFDIRDLVVGGGDAPPLLRITRFRLSWSFWEFLRNGSLSVRAIRIDRPVIDFSADRHREILAVLRRWLKHPDMPDLARLLTFLPDTVRLSIRNAGAGAALKTGVFRARGFGFDALVRDGRISLKGSGNLDFSPAGISGGRFVVGMRGRIKGSYDTAAGEGGAEIFVPALSGDFFRIRSLGLALELKDNTLRLHKAPATGIAAGMTAGMTAVVPALFPDDTGFFDFFLEYGLASRNFSARWHCEDFSPRNFISFSGDWKEYDSLLAMRSSGEAFIEGKIGTGAATGMKYRVDIEGAVPGTLPLGSTAFALKARGDETMAHIERGYLNLVQQGGKRILPRGRFGYQGSVGLNPPAPNGVLSLSGFSLTGAEGLSAEISVTTEGREISVFSETVTIGELVLTALDGRADFSSGETDFALSALRFTGMESYGETKLSSFSLEGTMEYEPRQIEASFTLDSFSVADMAAMIRPFAGEPDLPPLVRGIRNDLLVTTEIFFTTDFSHLLYNVPRLVIAYEGSTEVVALLSVSGTDQRFDLSGGRVLWSGGRFDLNGFADFASPADIAFSMMINYQDLSWFFEGQILDRRSLSIQGSYGFRVYAGMTGAGGYSGYAQAEDVP